MDDPGSSGPVASAAPALFAGDATAMANYYDTVLVPGLFMPWAVDLASRLPLAPTDHVLDVACGTGALSAAIAARLTDGGRLLGTDLAAGMLMMAVRRAIPRARFRVGDAVAQPVDDAGFDGVTCQQGLQFVPDRAAAVREMHRALKPGGWLAIACWTHISDQVPMLAFWSALRNRGWTDAANALAMPFSLCDKDELAGLVASSGFQDVRVETVTRDVHLPKPRDFAHGYAQVPPFAADYVAATGEERDAFADDVEAQLSSYATADGTSAPMTSNIVFATAV
jgi:ubiquinone/menaquinone biosynthesis C-methylase UbiE